MCEGLGRGSIIDAGRPLKGARVMMCTWVLHGVDVPLTVSYTFRENFIKSYCNRFYLLVIFVLVYLYFLLLMYDFYPQKDNLK